LGYGAFGKVKRIFDKKGNTYVAKVEGGRLEGNNELAILNFLGRGYGSAVRILSAEKEFLEHTIFRKIYTVSELKEGTELFNTLSTADDHGMRIKNLTQIQYLVIALKCCLCIAELHEQRIIHGDLKSENLILQTLPYDLTVHATDFAFSKILPFGQEIIKSTPQGTPDFTAPEIIDGGYFSKASDIYALGRMFEKDFNLPPQIWTPMVRSDATQRTTLDESMRMLADYLKFNMPKEDMLAQNALISLREFYDKSTKLQPILQLRPQVVYAFYRNGSNPSLLSWIYPNNRFKKRIFLNGKNQNKEYFLDLLESFCDSIQVDEELNRCDKACLFSGMFQKILYDDNNKSKTIKKMCVDYIRKIDNIYPQASQRVQQDLFKDKLDEIIARISRATRHRQTF
ncbi:MAG TPA: protein kinase, partial [Gammaproteobacteria bacterium]|nr:protein kinase [Gammaproteobacteria bacterium]